MDTGMNRCGIGDGSGGDGGHGNFPNVTAANYLSFASSAIFGRALIKTTAFR